MATPGSCAILSLVFATVYLLSSARAAWVINGNGPREVNITELLEAARAQRLRTSLNQEAIFTCARGDVIVREGYTWTERCQECKCTQAGIQCTGGPTCALEYKREQETTCAKFSADQCCCEIEGCITADGTKVPVGGAMPLDPARPCTTCTCNGANRTSCLIKTCWPYQCVDMVAPKAGECCPTCPNGKSCFLPYNEYTRLSQKERQSFPPIREFSPVTMRQGMPDEVTCVCERNMVAECSERSLQKQGFRTLNQVF